jgi:isoamylase
MDYTGCGNTPEHAPPAGLQLIMDSLRYWVLEMHVDGFRFDLASALARELHEVDRLGAFFDIIHQDPVLSQVKLIAEPWDLGEGGYQVGNFPPGWTEWNGRYRDTVRDYWRGEPGAMIGELATRLTGSSDLYEERRAQPVRQHQLRHRPRRLHPARPGQLRTRSTTRPTARTTATARTTTAAGTAASRDRPTTPTSTAARPPAAQLPRHPAAVAGRADAAGRRRDRAAPSRATTTPTARTTSWSSWLATGLTHALFHRRRYFEGRPVKGTGMKDAFWVTPQGDEMDDHGWHDRQARTIGMVLIGETIDETDRYGRRLSDDNFLLLLNAAADDVAFVLPSLATSGPWECVLDTAQDGGLRPEGRYQAGEPYPLTDRSLALLRQSNRHRRAAR